MRKPIVLYNTSIDAILTNKEQYLKKMRNVFEIFEGRKDVTLLWRPHPLLYNTIKTMLPALQDEYVNLVKWYKECQIGIFDDTSDLNRALAISDAYYGDGSSLVELYGLLHKPILVQNPNVEEKCYGYVPGVALKVMLSLDDNNFFGLTRAGGMAFVMEDDMRIIKFDDFELNDKELVDRIFSSVIKKEECLFLVLNNKPIVVKYDWKMKRSEKIFVENESEGRYEVFKDETNVYLIGLETMNVYRYDMCRNIFILIKAENKEVDLWCNKSLFNVRKMVFYDKKRLTLCIYDIQANDWIIVTDIPTKIMYILETEEEIWVATEQNELYRKQNSDGCWERILFTVPAQIDMLIDRGEFVFVFFNRGNTYLEINKKTIMCMEKSLEVLCDDLYHRFAKIDENRICIFHYSPNQYDYIWQGEGDSYSILNMLNYNVEKKYDFFKVFREKCNCSKLEVDNRMKMGNGQFLSEYDERTLVGFLEWLCMQNRKNCNNILKNHGETIHKFIMNL